MKLKHLLYMLLTLPLLWACSPEDDVQEIFVSGTWNVGNFYNGGDWSKYDNDGARVKYTKEEDIKASFENGELHACCSELDEALAFSRKTVYSTEHIKEALARIEEFLNEI